VTCWSAPGHPPVPDADGGEAPKHDGPGPAAGLSSRCSLRRSRSPFRRSTRFPPESPRHSSGEKDHGDRVRTPGPWVDHHTKDPVGAAMRARDFLIIGAPMLLGGAFLAAFLLRTWKGRSIARVLQAYRSCHDRLTEGLVSKRLLRFPGACLVSSLRPWAFAELFTLLVFLAVVSCNCSASGLAQATVLAALVGSLVAWVSFRGAARETLRSVQRDLQPACFSSPSDRIGNERLFGASGNVGLDPGRSARAGTGGTGPVTIARVPRGESIERSRRRVPLEEYRLFLNHVLQGSASGSGCHGACGNSPRRCWKARAPCGDIAQHAAVKMLFPWSFSSFPPCFSLSCPR